MPVQPETRYARSGDVNVAYQVVGGGPVDIVYVDVISHLELGWVIPWEFLRLLDLDGQGIGPEGVQEIARHERAANLRWLGLARNQIGHSGAKLLTQDSLLKPYFLDVRHNDLGAKDVLALKSRFPEAVVLA